MAMTMSDVFWQQIIASYHPYQSVKVVQALSDHYPKASSSLKIVLLMKQEGFVLQEKWFPESKRSWATDLNTHERHNAIAASLTEKALYYFREYLAQKYAPEKMFDQLSAEAADEMLRKNGSTSELTSNNPLLGSW